MADTSEIENLLAQESYSPQLIPTLEEHLLAQVKGEVEYMADSVRRLVKLYNLFPEKSKIENIGRACLLAALEYPNTDLLALSYLIPPSVTSAEPCLSILKCSTLLESCKFSEFWKTYETLKSSDDVELAQMTTRSVERVQKSILFALSLSYQEAPTKIVCAAINVESHDTIMALQHNSVVKSVDGDTVKFIPTVDNSERERVYQESIDFNSISMLMAKIAK